MAAPTRVHYATRICRGGVAPMAAPTRVHYATQICRGGVAANGRSYQDPTRDTDLSRRGRANGRSSGRSYSSPNGMPLGNDVGTSPRISSMAGSVSACRKSMSCRISRLLRCTGESSFAFAMLTNTFGSDKAR